MSKIASVDDIPPDRELVAVSQFLCADDRTYHVNAVKLANAVELSADNLVALIDAGRQYFMKPPPHLAALGLPLIVQTKMCDHCGKRVPFA